VVRVQSPVTLSCRAGSYPQGVPDEGGEVLT
jgi:hypothetical protein